MPKRKGMRSLSMSRRTASMLTHTKRGSHESIELCMSLGGGRLAGDRAYEEALDVLIVAYVDARTCEVQSADG